MSLAALTVRHLKGPGLALGWRWLDSPTTAPSSSAVGLDEVGQFMDDVQLWGNRWKFVPVGVGLDRQLELLWSFGMRTGRAPFGTSPWGRKPTLDLQHVMCVANGNAQLPDGARGDVPACFYGISLEHGLGIHLAAKDIESFIASGNHEGARRALCAEASAIVELHGRLVAKLTQQ